MLQMSTIERTLFFLNNYMESLDQRIAGPVQARGASCERSDSALFAQPAMPESPGHDALCGAFHCLQCSTASLGACLAGLQYGGFRQVRGQLFGFKFGRGRLMSAFCLSCMS